MLLINVLHNKTIVIKHWIVFKFQQFSKRACFLSLYDKYLSTNIANWCRRREIFYEEMWIFVYQCFIRCLHFGIPFAPFVAADKGNNEFRWIVLEELFDINKRLIESIAARQSVTILHVLLQTNVKGTYTIIELFGDSEVLCMSHACDRVLGQWCRPSIVGTRDGNATDSTVIGHVHHPLARGCSHAIYIDVHLLSTILRLNIDST